MNLRDKILYLMERDQIPSVAELSRSLNVPYKSMDNLLKREHFENVKFDTLRKLCNLFHVDLRYLCFDEITDPDFEKHTNNNQAETPPTLFSFSQDEKQLISDYRSLNEQGQAVVRDHMEMVAATPKYKKCNNISIEKHA